MTELLFCLLFLLLLFWELKFIKMLLYCYNLLLLPLALTVPATGFIKLKLLALLLVSGELLMRLGQKGGTTPMFIDKLWQQFAPPKTIDCPKASSHPGLCTNNATLQPNRAGGGRAACCR